ncbi:DUF1289 domain-containing protein [Pelagicoccus albus]|uniref:DUF1289 domain-containing protein n=1 Tax=Pelagicoccus albus TaxID=415222 RepID=A0A7X1B6M3_9BACT|nr:DUF1289 domain-containing protein [Pelagicoccus albus]
MPKPLATISNHPQYVPSPCIRVCTLSKDGRLCLGCGRTREEIASWLSADQSTRLQIVEQARKRLKRDD